MLALAFVPLIAAAGGGSGGFGGGGGGGFGGGGGLGGGGAGGASSGSWIGFAVLLAGLLLLVLFTNLRMRKQRTRRAARRRRVELASAEAADDDPRLAADAVTATAERLFRAAQAAWDARDDDRLRALLSPDLLVAWRRRLADFDARGWHNRVRVLDVRSVEYLGLVNRDGEDGDRVTCRITAELSDYVETASGARVLRKGAGSAVVALTEYWTLARRDGAWIVASIESDAEGAHVLGEEIVATPWQDEQRMRDADRDLLDVATPAAAAELLHPGDPSGKTRLVIRGPRVERLRIAALDPAATPPTMTIELKVRGRRYVEDRDDASVLSGSKERATTVRERWTLALSGPDDRPWQIVGVA